MSPSKVQDPQEPAEEATEATPGEQPAEIAEVPAEISEVVSDQESVLDETPLPADEMEEEQAELVDVELAQVISTPAGMKGALEAILFISPEALTLRRLCNLLDTRDKNLVEAALRQLQIELDAQRRGIRLLEGAEGWRMVTREMFGELILRLRGRKRRPPMSPAALETLAIIAYRPGIIRAEIEAIRGVESSGTLRNLIDMGLIEITGRRDVLGRPPLYATTQAFLEAFGLKSLTELPQISELKAEFIKTAKAAEEREIEETKARPHSPDPDQQPEPQPAEDSLAADEQADEAAEEELADEDLIEEEEGEELTDEEAEEVLDEEAAATDELADEEQVEELDTEADGEEELDEDEDEDDEEDEIDEDDEDADDASDEDEPDEEK